MPPPTEDRPAPGFDTAEDPVAHRSAPELGRRRDVVMAGHLADEALARAALTDPSPSVKAAALGALERLGILDTGSLDQALGDGDPLVRRRACELFATRPDHGGESLAAMLDDHDGTVVEAACFALGELADRAGPLAAPALSAVVAGHDDPLCREAAVAALGALGDPAGLPAILAATTDKAAVRRRAVLALAPFEGADVDAALARAAADRDWQVRQAAEDLGVGPAAP